MLVHRPSASSAVRALIATIGAAVALGAPTAARALPTLPTPSNVGRGGMALVASSCPSPGGCSAIAGYRDTANDSQVALFDQVGGSWRSTVLDLSQLVTLAPHGDLTPESIACASAGNCTIAGYYQDNSQTYQGFVATETAGVWSPASEVQLPSNVNTTNYGSGQSGDEDLLLASVSCVAAGDCTVFGTYDATAADADEPFTLTQTGGSWSQAVEAPLPADASQVYAGLQPAQISCPTAGACTAYGSYATTGGGQAPFVLEGAGSSWTATGLSLAGLPDPASAQPAFQTSSGAGTLGSSLACPSAGDCTAIGSYVDAGGGEQGLLFSESGGVWTATSTGLGSLAPAATSNPAVSLVSLSCGTAGDCVADGVYRDLAGHTQGLTVAETGGAWQQAKTIALPPDASSDPEAYPASVACSAAGNCVMSAFYRSSANTTEQALLTGGEASLAPTSVPLGTALPAGAIPPDEGAAAACAASGYCSVLDAFNNGSSIVAMSAPGAPSVLSATTAADLGSLSWSAPADDGGFPVTGYTVTALDTTHPTATVTPQSLGPSATTAGFPSAFGDSYELTLTAANILGPGIPVGATAAAVLPTRGQAIATLERVVRPRGPGVSLRAIRRAGGFTFSYEALEPGTLSVHWYHTLRTGRGRHRRTRLLRVADGRLTIARAGGYRVRVTLTTAGRRLLRRARTLVLTQQLVLGSAQLSPIRLSRRFTLR